MNLYKITVGHYSPKDSHLSTDRYILAQDENELYDLMCTFTYWNEKDYDFIVRNIPDSFLPYTIELSNEEDYTDEQKFFLDKGWREYIISTKGELNSDWASYDDLYYGQTHYGWELIKEVKPHEIELLKSLSIIC